MWPLLSTIFKRRTATYRNPARCEACYIEDLIGVELEAWQRLALGHITHH